MHTMADDRHSSVIRGEDAQSPEMDSEPQEQGITCLEPSISNNHSVVAMQSMSIFAFIKYLKAYYNIKIYTVLNILRGRRKLLTLMFIPFIILRKSTIVIFVASFVDSFCCGCNKYLKCYFIRRRQPFHLCEELFINVDHE